MARYSFEDANTLNFKSRSESMQYAGGPELLPFGNSGVKRRIGRH